jgi:hypothetical protein
MPSQSVVINDTNDCETVALLSIVDFFAGIWKFHVLNRGVRLKRTLIDLKSFISKQEDLLYGRLNGR